MVSTRNSSTHGLVSTRCTTPVSTSSESSSKGSSVAWWLPTMSTGRDFDSAPMANSARLRNEWPGGTSARSRDQAARRPRDLWRRAASSRRGWPATPMNPANSSRAAQARLASRKNSERSVDSTMLPANAASMGPPGRLPSSTSRALRRSCRPRRGAADACRRFLAEASA